MYCQLGFLRRLQVFYIRCVVSITGYPGTTLKENEVFFKKVGI